MKKAYLSLFTFLLLMGTLTAQDSPAKALKSARSMFSKAKVASDDEKKEKLMSALESINIAITGVDQMEAKDQAKVWLQAGAIHNELVQKDISMRLLQPEHPIAMPGSATEAYKAFAKALGVVQKKYEKKDAMDGLQTASNSLAIIGNEHLNAKEYEKAYVVLNDLIKVHEITKAEGEPVVLKTEAEYNDHLFVVAFTSMITDRKEEAAKHFKHLIAQNYDDARIYGNYASIVMVDDEQAALDIIAKGREKYPNDTEIMFAEINYYIQKQEFDKLKVILAEAMEKAPDNPSVPSALGNVYMNLFQQEYKAGNKPKGDEYFAESKKYYDKALEIKPDMFEAVYSIGSLYYNKAVEVATEMNALGNTKAELKKYDAMAEQMKGHFNEALPFFKKAEKMNPNDANTLIALKEIFARNDDFETSGEFKKRLELVQGGGKVDSAYFK